MSSSGINLPKSTPLVTAASTSPARVCEGHFGAHILLLAVNTCTNVSADAASDTYTYTYANLLKIACTCLRREMARALWLANVSCMHMTIASAPTHGPTHCVYAHADCRHQRARCHMRRSRNSYGQETKKMMEMRAVCTATWPTPGQSFMIQPDQMDFQTNSKLLTHPKEAAKPHLVPASRTPILPPFLNCTCNQPHMSAIRTWS